MPREPERYKALTVQQCAPCSHARDQMIDRYRPRPSQKNEQEKCGPGEMLDPSLRIDEHLDDDEHAEQR